MSTIKIIEINGAWYAYSVKDRAALKSIGLDPRAGFLMPSLLEAHASKYDYQIVRTSDRKELARG